MRTGQEEKSDGGEVSSHPAEFALIVLLATVRPLPWTKSFNFEGARGGVLFQGFGLVMVFFFFNFGVCACVCIVLRLHIYSSPSKRWPPPWTAAQWTIRLGKKTLLAAVPPGSSRSHFECVFPSAGALDSSLVIICLWKWETGIVDPTHILNL